MTSPLIFNVGCCVSFSTTLYVILQGINDYISVVALERKFTVKTACATCFPNSNTMWKAGAFLPTRHSERRYAEQLPSTYGEQGLTPASFSITPNSG